MIRINLRVKINKITRKPQERKTFLQPSLDPFRKQHRQLYSVYVARFW